MLEIIYPIHHHKIYAQDVYRWSSALSSHVGFHGRSDTQVSWREELLILRMPEDLLKRALGLEGVELRAHEDRAVLGAPLIRELKPLKQVSCPFVIFKSSGIERQQLGRTGVGYIRALRRRLDTLGIGRVELELDPKLRRLPFKGHDYKGHAMTFKNLSASDSLAILKHGLGSMSNYGCGVFHGDI